MIYQYGIRWTTSRGRDTYGYNICTMTGEGLKGRCIGGCDCVERVVSELIGASVEWEYARDRKGRPTHRSGVIIER